MSAANDYCEAAGFFGMFGEVIYDSFIVNGRLRVETLGLPFGRGCPTSALAFFCKPSAFAYEMEWRLLLWKRAAGRSSTAVPIPDPSKFIERVLVSPEAPDWVVEGVRELVQIQFGLRGIGVERSPLAAHLRS